MKMINAIYLNMEWFLELSQAKLLCSLSDDALFWGLATAPHLCKNAECASNTKENFAARSSFHIFLAKPFPLLSLPSLCPE